MAADWRTRNTLNINEAAVALDVCRRTIYNYIKQTRLDTFKQHGSVRVTVESIVKLRKKYRKW